MFNKMNTYTKMFLIYIFFLMFTSLFILGTSLSIKENTYFSSGIAHIHLYSQEKEGIFTMNTLGVFVTIFFALSIFFGLVFFGCSKIYNQKLMIKQPILWTTFILMFLIIFSYIIQMLGNSWSSNGPIISNMVSGGNDDINYDGGTMSILLFCIVGYCCLIISCSKITYIIFKKKEDIYKNTNELTNN